MGGYETHGTLKAHALRDRLLNANTPDVPIIVKDMTAYRRWLDPLLRDASREAEANQEARKQLHISLALLPWTPRKWSTSTVACLPPSVGGAVIRDALAPYRTSCFTNSGPSWLRRNR